MIKRTMLTLVCGLTCLSLIACGALRLPAQQELGASEVGLAENTATLTKETGPAPTVTMAPEAAGDEVDISTTEANGETAPGGLTAAETVAPDMAPVPGNEVYAQKVGETLALPGCYDFDEGASLAPPDSACDFSMLPGPDGGTIEVYPQGGAGLAYGGVFPEKPTRAQCAASDAYSSEREIVAPMAAMYVCYVTAEGRIGYLHFTAAHLAQAGTLTFDWVTFATGVEDEEV